jgi:signal peptide peptidase SppA
MKRDALVHLSAQPWAIHRPSLEGILGRVAALDPSVAAGLFNAPTKAQVDDITARRAVTINALTRPGPKTGAVAVVPIRGVIMQRDSLFTWLFGGTSCEWLMATVEQLMNDDSVTTILLDVDSPGGSTAGVTEAAGVIRAAAAAKNVVAIGHPIAASSAYWLISGADEIVATPDSFTGAIGVYMVHEDWSKALDIAGVAVTFVESAPFKTETESEKPLTDAAKAHLQALVDEHGRLFVEDVAAGRKIDAKKVVDDFGGGTVFHARAAKASGMVDRVGTFQETLARLTGTRATVTAIGAAATPEAIAEAALSGSEPTDPPEVVVVDTTQSQNEDTEADPAEGSTFSSRLTAVMAEAADLAAIARSRVDRRAGSRKPLSAAHDADMEALERSLLETAASLHAAKPADEEAQADLTVAAARKRRLALAEATVTGQRLN